MIAIPFVENDLNLPIVEISIDGKKCLALVDSGSQLTFFDESLNNDEEDSRQCQMNLAGISGENKYDCIKRNVTVGFGIKFLDMSVFYIDLNTIFPAEKAFHCIIGNDVLGQYKMKIDYKNNHLWIPIK